MRIKSVQAPLVVVVFDNRANVSNGSFQVRSCRHREQSTLRILNIQSILFLKIRASLGKRSFPSGNEKDSPHKYTEFTYDTLPVYC